MNPSIRQICPRDNPYMEHIIKQVMTEYKAVGAGYSIEDPEVAAMYEAYNQSRANYFVVEVEQKILGGAGFAQLDGVDGHICELRKMYLLKESRGLGVGRMLLEKCLNEARQSGYTQCYLETLESMTDARRLYERAGFYKLQRNMGNTGHFNCNSWMLVEL